MEIILYNTFKSDMGLQFFNSCLSLTPFGIQWNSGNLLQTHLGRRVGGQIWVGGWVDRYVYMVGVGEKKGEEGFKSFIFFHIFVA